MDSGEGKRNAYRENKERARASQERSQETRETCEGHRMEESQRIQGKVIIILCHFKDPRYTLSHVDKTEESHRMIMTILRLAWSLQRRNSLRFLQIRYAET